MALATLPPFYRLSTKEFFHRFKPSFSFEFLCLNFMIQITTQNLGHFWWDSKLQQSEVPLLPRDAGPSLQIQFSKSGEKGAPVRVGNILKREGKNYSLSGL